MLQARCQKVLQSYISRLAERHFLVGASVRHMLVVDGQPEALAWPMLRVEVQLASEAQITESNGVPIELPDVHVGEDGGTRREDHAATRSSSAEGSTEGS